MRKPAYLVAVSLFLGSTCLTFLYYHFTPPFVSPLPEKVSASEVTADYSYTNSPTFSYADIAPLKKSLEEPPSVSPSPTSLPSPTPTETPTPTLTPSPSPLVTATPTPTTSPTPLPTVTFATGTDLDRWFDQYANQYSVDRDVLHRIARCESGFNQNATNGDYVGLYQFASASWTSVRAQMGTDTNTALRTNPEEAIKTAAYMLSKGQASAWPNC